MKVVNILILFVVVHSSNAFAEKVKFDIFNEEMVSNVSLTEEFVGWCAIYKALIHIAEDSTVEETLDSVRNQLSEVREAEMARVKFNLDLGSVMRDDSIQESPFGSIYIKQTFESPDSIILESMDITIRGADICEFSTHENGNNSIANSALLEFLRSL